MPITLMEWLESLFNDGDVTLKPADPPKPTTSHPDPRICQHKWEMGINVSHGSSLRERGKLCERCGAIRWPDGSITVNREYLK